MDEITPAMLINQLHATLTRDLDDSEHALMRSVW